MSSPETPSSPFPDKLCQACGSAKATHFITQIIDGQQTNLELCPTCSGSHFAHSGFKMPDMDNARCFYCNDAAVTGRRNQPYEFASRQQPFHHTCFRCAQLSTQLTLAALSTTSRDLSPADQMQRIAEIVREADEQIIAQVRPG